MRRILLFIVCIWSVLSLTAEPFYVRINGSRDVAAANTGVQDYQGRTQYAAMNVSLTAGDKITCYDAGSGAAWNIAKLDPYGAYTSFAVGSDALNCNATGVYNVYIKMKMNDDIWYIEASNGDTPEPIVPQDYDVAVPEQSEDIMLQAFYWDSNYDKGYGDTRWTSLTSQATEIGNYFTLVWLPPSSEPNNGGLGYIAKCYSNQNSSLGNSTELAALVNTLHSKSVRVIADVVINHCGNSSSWCDFRDVDFGTYGHFYPQSTWITSNDEAQGKCTLGANADDGQHEANYGAARDWDHKNAEVQNMCKAYTKWLKNTIHYDGFRYDYCGGFHVSHINDYNQASKPYFSVMEYWIGDASELKTRIDQANKNTLTFDFSLKYNALRDGIFKKSYTKCLKAGMRGKGYSKYAVTFIDNHDTFARSESEDVANKKDGSSIDDKSLMMRCNAYILSLPGVPCVFYPHWVKYKAEIKKMIDARRAAGIHSESTMEETAASGYYRATIHGTKGNIKLMLGTAATDEQPAGYTLVIKGDDYAMYYNDVPEGIESMKVAAPVLDYAQPMYNLLGMPVDASYRGVVIQNGHKFIN